MFRNVSYSAKRCDVKKNVSARPGRKFTGGDHIMRVPLKQVMEFRRRHVLMCAAR